MRRNRWVWLGLDVFILVCASMVIATVSCATVPITGRQQLQLVPPSQLQAMAVQSYREYLAGHRLSKDQQQVERVRRVGTRIQKAVEEFFRSRGESYVLSGYQWEFNLVEDDQVNAWCMPGGKVVVYTGILKVADTDEKLAVVMAHEIAHAVAQHGAERMSQALLVQFGGMALGQALKTRPAETQEAFLKAFNVGSTVGLMLPFSRVQELEADRLGLIFMAMAGYHPHAAVEFWRTMSQQQRGGAVLEILSTHPSDERRIQQIQQLMPEALQYYRPMAG